jgi:prepilin-type N-terminal cleavage/methylation domain-containing protein
MTTRAAHALQGRSVSGFSLLEIIVALSIMTIIVGTAIPVISVSIDRKKKEETRQELNALKTAVEGYFQDVRALPPSLDDLENNLVKVAGWVGPYINPPLSLSASTLPVITKDAWNMDYRVTFTGSSRMEIRSPGRGGAFGTSDDIAVDVDVTYLRRKDTLAELEIINTAIQVYNVTYLSTKPLPCDWSRILRMLQETGYLPSRDTSLATDGWDSPYDPDPLGQAPVVRVASVNMK